MQATGNLVDEEAQGALLALRGWVARRCARAYLHEFRGSLQALISSTEFLKRVALGATAGAAAPANKAVELSRRALASHEATLDGIIRQLCGEEGGARHEVGMMIEAALALLRHEAVAKDLELEAGGSTPGPAVSGEFRLLLLALLAHAIDHADRGSRIGVLVADCADGGIEDAQGSDSNGGGTEGLRGSDCPNGRIEIEAPRWESGSADFRLVLAAARAAHPRPEIAAPGTAGGILTLRW